MFEDRIAYRWRNNEVEGFVGAGTTAAAARANAISQIRAKCDVLNEAFDTTRVIIDDEELTSAELLQLCDDWGSINA